MTDKEAFKEIARQEKRFAAADYGRGLRVKNAVRFDTVPMEWFVGQQRLFRTNSKGKWT